MATTALKKTKEGRGPYISLPIGQTFHPHWDRISKGVNGLGVTSIYLPLTGRKH